MDPILKYPGAKWRIADWIIAHMPPHEGYLEPYFGSGAVFFNKPKSRVETINDIDGSVVRFFKTCREQPEALAYALSLTPWSREEFLQSDFGEENPDDVEAARQFAVRCWMTFGARTRCKTGWRHTTGAKRDGGPDNPKLWSRLPEQVFEVCVRLMEAQIENRPAVEVIELNNGPEILIYADPPYMMQTRTLNGGQYRYEMSDEDHETLLRILLQHDGMIMISGYECPMYDDLLSGWEKVQKRTTAERAQKRTECLWLNKAAADHLKQMRMEV